MAGNEILLTCLVAWATDKLPINSNYEMLTFENKDNKRSFSENLAGKWHYSISELS